MNEQNPVTIILMALGYTILNAVFAVIYYGIIFAGLGWICLLLDSQFGWGLSEKWSDFKTKSLARRAEHKKKKEAAKADAKPHSGVPHSGPGEAHSHRAWA